MDPYSHRLANALAGNVPSAATLEVTLIGPELVFEDERVVAVAGAEFELTLDGRAVAANTAFASRPARVCDSAATAGHPRLHRHRRRHRRAAGARQPRDASGQRDGRLDGRALEAGDRLPLGEPGPQVRLHSAGTLGVAQRSGAYRWLPDGHARVRVLPGPQADYFADDALQVLQSAPYTVGRQSDRMGFRLEVRR